MRNLGISSIAIITVKVSDYHCVVHAVSKPDAINLLENYVLVDTRYTYKMLHKEILRKRVHLLWFSQI